MKHLITILALATVASTAQAGTYSDSVKVQEICAIRGKFAVEAYISGTVSGITKEKAREAVQDKSLTQGGYEYLMQIFYMVENDRPDRAEGAYMRAWAACMDKFR